MIEIILVLLLLTLNKFKLQFGSGHWTYNEQGYDVRMTS